MQKIENNTPKVRSVRTLKQWIQEGQLRIGEQLPPENDLARLLNVSRTTVRAAIKSIEDEGLLRYQDNRRRVVVGAVQRNSTLMANTIAILTTIEDRPEDHDPFRSAGGWERFIQVGLIHAIQQAGMHALTLQAKLLQKALIKGLEVDRPRGVVLMRPKDQPAPALELAQMLKAQRVPVVCYESTDSAEFDTIGSDHEWGSHELTKWLIAQGRQRILRIWPACRQDMPYWRKQRASGYDRAISETKLNALPLLELPPTSADEEATQADFQRNVRLMVGYLYEYLNGPEPVDALMALTDGSCFSLAAACRILGKEPGKDIFIVGYDNYWQESPLRPWESFVPQATVDKLNVKLGQELMALLLARAEGSLPPEPQVRLIKPELRITAEVLG